LNSLGVDLNRVLGRPVSEQDMRRFLKGERGIFVRALVDANEREVNRQIRSRYEQDEQFRSHVGKYLAQFDTLLAQANATDPENLLSATILTADVGKVYMLLSRAIGRAQPDLDRGATFEPTAKMAERLR
jgi:hypothetical protein